MRDDIFLVDVGRDGLHLVYAPKHMVMFAVNAAGAEAFQKLKNGESDAQTESIRRTLEKAGLDKEPPEISTSIAHPSTFQVEYRGQASAFACIGSRCIYQSPK